MRKKIISFLLCILLLTSPGCSNKDNEKTEHGNPTSGTAADTLPFSAESDEFTLPDDVLTDSKSAFIFTIESFTKAINTSRISEAILPEKAEEWLEYPDMNTADGITEYVWRADAKAYLSPSIAISVNSEGYITEVRTDRSEEAMTEKGVADFKLYSKILLDILCNIEGSEASELTDTMSDEAHATLYGTPPNSRTFNGVCVTAYYNADRCTFSFAPSKH